jgi:polar amino acid transport system substrate-binding protein
MGAAQEAGRLRVGLPEDAPPLGFRDRSGAFGGMGAGLGRLVADALEVPPAFEHGSAEELLAAVERAELDIAFPALTLTEGRLRRYSFTNPYVVAHQRLLVPRRSQVAAVGDLRGGRVCVFLDEATGADLSAIEPSIQVVATDEVARCLRLLASGRVDAVSADDVFLEYMLEDLRGARIVGDDLSTVGYGAVVVTGASNFAAIVEQIFADAESDGRWADIYRRWVGTEPDGEPELTAEEAAALYPIGAR